MSTESAAWYGPRAVIAGASEGIGAEMADQLASRRGAGPPGVVVHPEV
ncbi:hypothetical protein [Mycobacterium sp. IS-1590]|nr:hypothetical protein [Mycobacterium sp. IS-1590]